MIAKLIEGIQRTQAPICVGLDPMLSYVPTDILQRATDTYGETLEAAAEAIYDFNTKIIDATCDLVPAVKPQIAMYEQYGIFGLVAFKRTVDYAHEKGLVVIGDVKRGDIGSTSAAYAAAHIGTVTVGENTYRPFDEDFVTVNPYLGSDGVKPFIDAANDNDRGIFVLVKTSNPSSGELQDQVAEQKAIYEHVGALVDQWGRESMDGSYSNVGAVVGATYPKMGEILRSLMPKNYILVPGYGAQGGSGEDLKPFFNEDGLGAIVNSSRGIICAYREEKYAAYGEAGFAEAAREAVLAMKEDIAHAIG